MKNKYLILTAISLLFAKLSFAQCQLTKEQVIVGDIYLGQTVKDFQQKYPEVSLIPDSNDKSRGLLDFYFRKDATDTTPTFDKMAVNRHIAYKNGVISSYAFGFDEPYADFDTSLESLKNKVINWYRLPKTGWKKINKTRYQLNCKDFQIEVSQDHGSGRQALDPGIMVESTK